ncbi:MAG: DUF2384 domain-containing protein [Bacteroidetes bacterium]|nr:DUF2384 domain-containing protein [Bacteroidota bacterium]
MSTTTGEKKRTAAHTRGKGKKTKTKFELRTGGDLLVAVSVSLPKKQVRDYLVQGRMPRALLSTVLNISSTKLSERISGSGNLLPAESERVVLTEQLLARGTAAFGDLDVFMAWLKDENVLLGERPIELIRSTTGMALVLDELISIEHGIPA